MGKYIRDFENGERVRVHRNLNNGMMSVLSWNNKHDDKGRVIGYATDLFLEDCKMVVQPAGSRKAKETKERNVHAFIEGNLVLKDKVTDVSYDGQVQYHPFKTDDFVLVKGDKMEPIKECKYVQIIDGKRVIASK